MQFFYLVALIGCLAGQPCDTDLDAGMETWLAEEGGLQSRIDGQGSLAATAWRFRVEGSAAMLLWQSPPERPCGDLDRTSWRCVGLWHVEVDRAIERRQAVTATFQLRPEKEVGLSVGVGMYRRTVNQRDGEWPDCYTEGCHTPENWHGRGHSDHWGPAIRAAGPEWHIQLLMVQYPLDEHPSLPHSDWIATGEASLGHFDLSGRLAFGGGQPPAGTATAAVDLGPVSAGLRGGWQRPPGVGKPFPIAALRVQSPF